MAVLLIEGFDTGAITFKGWTLTIIGLYTGVTGVSLTTPRLGTAGYSLLQKCQDTAYPLGGTTITLTKVLPSTATTAFLGLGVYRDSLAPSAGSASVDFLTAAGAHVASLGWDGSKQPYIVDAAYGTVVTSSFVHTDGTWNYYELKIVVNGASGSCELMINGGADISATTGNFGSTAIGKLQFGMNRGAGGDQNTVVQIVYDDVYVCDDSGSAPRNDFLGDCRVETIVPSGAGNSTVWTPNTGANYAAVDELTGTFPDGDTTYVSSGTPGDIDTYACDDLTVSSGIVYGVQTNLYARKDDAGLRQIAPMQRVGGTDYVGSTSTLTTSYLYYSELFNQDPTASDWTISTVNAAQFGVKVIT